MNRGLDGTDPREGELNKGKEMDRDANRASENDRLYAIKSIHGKGQGWVAASKIRKGTRISAETPAFKVPRFASPQNVESIIIKGLKNLGKGQQRAFFALYNAHGSRYSPFLGISKTNVLPLGPKAPEGGLFLEASRINHACNPNSQNTWNDNLNKLTIHSIKDIEEGEEITISYLDASEIYKVRQQSLKTGFGFDCACELCSLPSVLRRESDGRLDEITRLDELIGDGMRITCTPLACLHDAHTLLRLLKEERITDARIARLYYDALQIAIANGDQARAKVFAERAHAARVVLEGEDSPETIRLKGFAERPADHRLYGTAMKWKQAAKKVPQGLGEEQFEDWLWMKGNRRVQM